MFENITLPEAARFAATHQTKPNGLVLLALDSNNTELKISAQGPLEEGVPTLYTDVRDDLVSVCELGNLEPVGSYFVYNALNRIDEAFVKLGHIEGDRVATQTKDGRQLSAALGGHLLKLSLDTNASLRAIIGEKRRYGAGPDETNASNAIQGRLTILSILWRDANKDWQSISNLQKTFEEEAGIPRKTVHDHLRKLMIAGLLEREEPKTSVEIAKRNYHIRLKQENGFVAPNKIIERFLSVVRLASTTDPDFVDEGLKYLREMTNDPNTLPYLLQRAQVSYKNGRKAVHPVRVE